MILFDEFPFWQTYYGFLVGIHFTLITVLLITGIMNFIAERKRSANIVFASMLTTIGFVWSMLYFERLLNTDPLVSVSFSLIDIGGIVCALNAIVVLWLYYNLFYISILQPHYDKFRYLVIALALGSVALSLQNPPEQHLFSIAILPMIVAVGVVFHHAYFQLTPKHYYAKYIIPAVAIVLFMLIPGAVYISLGMPTPSLVVLPFLTIITLAITLYTLSGYELLEKLKEIDATGNSDLITRLLTAIKNESFHMVYQPQIDLSTQEICGMEALIRWRDNGKFISPGVFIPLAETIDEIQPITLWVINDVIKQCSELRDKGYTGKMSLNMSVKSILHETADAIISALDEHNVPPDMLVLEITETTLMENTEENKATLKRLIKHGVLISLDDYGTGYSSLSYLNRIKLYELKIDRFFTNLIDDDTTKVIINSTIQMCHDLNVKVVAEGVEHEQMIDTLSSLDCDIAQGFHIAKPMDVEALYNWMESHEHAKLTA